MHGRGGGEHRKRSRHMRSVPTLGTRGTNTAVACDYSSSAVDYFYKDGRKIQVGDCALFKLPQDSTHIIGLIRWLSPNKEKNLSLCVNKLYRPIELKLGKGILLDTLPNEVFYSFRWHEIPAASLLHPCKVAFLNKGVELPSGISSFVCRRVFDPDISCLQWLSDQEYIDEQQEELDRLLYKTRIEMHASGRSPKPINGPTSTSQLKSGSDNVQTASSVPTQAKGRKRERADQGSEPIKRERSLKADGCDSVLYRSESNLKFEISRITEKGGLVDSEGVVKLVQLMQPNRVDKNLELVSQSMLAGVITATENFDCLTRFVQLKGLPVLDQWLQDVHKGKVGDGSPKDVDKSTEEFLLILLRALDKLPVNLQALQMCNIGKSVNHLRTYKNSEIQKKARSLVDTWKKRVEAEMNVIDAKSVSNQAVSWQSRSRLPEGSHGGNRQHGGPSEAALKSPSQFSAEKIASTKPALAEISVKLATSSPGPTKVLTSPASGKDGEPRSVVGSNPDLPSNTARDERSSSSSQSHNSQSCSSDHAKTIGLSGKEDARSSTARSISANKVTGGSSRPRRSVNGHPVSAAPSGSPRETGSSRITSLHRNLASEKLSQSGVTCEKALDLPTIDGSCHKLIVKLPNRGRSPVQSSSVGPVEDPAVMHSRVSSSVLSEKNDQSDSDSKEKADVKITSDVKTESWQSNDFKDILTGSDEGDGSPDAIAEGSRNGNGDAKLADTYKAVSNSLGNKLESGKLHDASYNPINALIESCVNYSQVNASISGGDDGGMNLLASVAAGEMSKSNLPSTDGSSGRTSNIREESGMGDESRSRETNGDNKLVREPCRSEEGLLGMAKQGNPISVMREQAAGEDQDKSFKLDSKTIVNLDPHINDRSDEVKDIASISTLPTCAAGKILMGDKSKQLDEKDETNIEAEKSKEDCFSMNDTTLLCSVDAINPNVDHVTSCLEVKREASVGVPSNASLDADNENKDGCNSEQRQSLEVQADAREGCNGLSKDFPSKSTNKFEGIKLEDNECENLAGKRSIGQGTSNVSSNEGHGNRMTCDLADESKKIESSATNDSAGASHVNKKPKFDLNEGFNSDDGKLGDPMNFEDTDVPVSAHMVNPLPFPVASMTSGLPASVTVATAAKGPFVPPTDLLRSKRELGWKGSAATSAFRPAEPRKALEVPSVVGSTPDAGASKHKRPMLDFDLNVADERIVDDVVSRNSAHEIASTSAHAATILEFSPKKPLVSFPLRCSVGLDLDLNRDDEAGDMWLGSASSGLGLEVPFFPAKSSSLSGYPISESRRDLDLNNGPVLDEAVESSLHNKQMRTNIQSQPFLASLRTSTEETGTFSSWFPPGNAFSPVTIPSIISGRGDQPFPVVTANGPPRVLGPPVGPIPPELYRGSVLSSSPAVPFSSLQYPAFSLGTGFPLPSGSLSGASNTYTDSLSNGRLGLAASNAQLLSGPPSVVTSHFPRPYAVSILDGSNSTSVGNNSKLGRQGLDLNTGPGTQEMESRDESSPLVSKHLSVFSPQVLAEEQGRMNKQVTGGVLKRKEDTDIRYKQPSWQ